MNLVDRLRDPEDQFVERKPQNAGRGDFKRTIVAFANSVPQNRTAILFVGVADDGTPLGVDNPDRTQKDIRKYAESDCYPPIFVDTEVLTVGGKQLVAVLVNASSERPHFSGAAYVRRGSESVGASEELYERLLASRHALVHRLVDWIGKAVTVTEVQKKLGEYIELHGDHVSSEEYQISEVTPHYVRFYRPSTGTFTTEILECLRLSWDDKKNRPRLLAFQFRSPGA